MKAIIELESRIRKLLPELQKDKIEISHVLRCLGNDYALCTKFIFLIKQDGGDFYLDLSNRCGYNLLLPLSEQPPETIEWLLTIIK